MLSLYRNLFFYTSFLPIFILLSTTLQILLTHNNLPPPPSLHLTLTVLLLVSTVFLTSLQTRCELLLPNLQLPNICPSLIRTTNFPEGQSGPVFGKPIWFSISVVRVCLGVLLVLSYLALSIVIGIEVKRERQEKRDRRKNSLEVASSIGGNPGMGEYWELREGIGRPNVVGPGDGRGAGAGFVRMPMAARVRQSLIGGEDGIIRLMNFNSRV